MTKRAMWWLVGASPLALAWLQSPPDKAEVAHPVDPGKAGIGTRIPDLAVSPLNAKPAKLSQISEGKPLVVILTDASCPLCVKYGPSLARLETEYRAKGVRFLFLNPSEDTADEAREMINRLGWKSPYVLAGGRQAAAAFRPQTTTEAYILDGKLTLRYRGAVDDQYGIGYSRANPRHTYLRDALNAVLGGKSPAVPATWAPGCLIDLKPDATPIPAATYSSDIARIIQKNCITCHRTGGIGPFPLETYDQVKSRAKMLNFAIERGIMPPWFAAPTPTGQASPWKNDRTIPAKDKALFAQWVDAGMPEGDRAKTPPNPEFSSEWEIGNPDLVLQIPKPIAVKAEGVMAYQNIIVPTNVTEDKWVSALEILPTARQVVHHVLVFVMPPGSSRRDPLEEVSGFFAGYVPGNAARIFPAGTAKFLPANSRLRFQIHYTPNGKETEDQIKLGMIFSKQPPKNEIRTVGIASLNIAIPPGANNHEVSAQLPVPRDAMLYGFVPHMHVRGKAAEYELVQPDGARQTLLSVPRYDFNWQLNYEPRQPILVRQGSRIIFTAWYDNSDQNPANPDPTKLVRWGEQTYDEMHLGYIECTIPSVPAGEPMPRMRSNFFANNPALAGGVETIFNRLDANKDGFVDEAEAGRSWFIVREADANEDGRVTLAEAKAHFGDASRARRGGGRRNG